MRVVTLIKNLLSPPYCIACEALLSEHAIICQACWETRSQLFSQTVPYRGSHALTVHALFAYEQPIRSLVLGKLSGNSVSIHQLAQLVVRRLPEYHLSCDYVVPVPLHWFRRLFRGFNQADILARAVAHELNVPMLPVLKRIRNTQFQSQLSAQERVHNVKGAFTVKERYRNRMTGKKILIIDDLFTTGATIAQAARVLTQSGAQDVEVLVACKAMI